MRFAPYIMLLASIVLSIYFYSYMPQNIASHWNAAGEADGYMPKYSIFFFPALILIVNLIFEGARKIDPLSANNKPELYFTFASIISIFMLYVHMISIAWNILKFNFTQLMIPGISVLFFLIGTLLSTANRNWFIGVRTPWTMQSDSVWQKTHKATGKVFQGIALIWLAGLLYPEFAILFIVATLPFAVVFAVGYSYIEYEKEKKIGKRKIS